MRLGRRLDGNPPPVGERGLRRAHEERERGAAARRYAARAGSTSSSSGAGRALLAGCARRRPSRLFATRAPIVSHRAGELDDAGSIAPDDLDREGGDRDQVAEQHGVLQNFDVNRMNDEPPRVISTVIERELTDVLQRWGSGAAGDRPRVRGPRSPSRGRAARSTSASRIRRFRTISRSCGGEGDRDATQRPSAPEPAPPRGARRAFPGAARLGPAAGRSGLIRNVC